MQARARTMHRGYRPLVGAELRPVSGRTGRGRVGSIRPAGPLERGVSRGERRVKNGRVRGLNTHTFIGACPAQGTGDCRIRLGRDTRSLGRSRPVRRPLFPRCG